MAAGFDLFEIIILFIAIIIVVGFYYTLKASKKSTKIGDFLPAQGVKITFAASPRRVGLLVAYDKDPATGLISLIVKYVGLKPTDKTGYIFKEDDFMPRLSNIDITATGEPIICWKSIDGLNDARDATMREYIEREKLYRKLYKLHQQQLAELLQIAEGKISSEKRKEEVIENAKALRALKDITNTANLKFVDKNQKGSGLKDLFG